MEFSRPQADGKALDDVAKQSIIAKQIGDTLDKALESESDSSGSSGDTEESSEDEPEAESSHSAHGPSQATTSRYIPTGERKHKRKKRRTRWR